MAAQDWPVLVHRGRARVGVVLVHDITGLDAQNRRFAEQLAAEGFWVAAVDLFRGQTAGSIQEGMALRQALTPQAMREALRAGLDRLRAEAGPIPIGSMGFCMGGGAALEGACHAGFAFCVDYYGMIADADDVRGLQGPLLLILASEDDRINPWAYGQLLPKLDEHRKRVEVQLYPAVIHPFHRPDWVQAPFPGAPRSYDEAAARDAWGRAVRLIRTFSMKAPL
jgi:carboxymethylenebutenolidase